MHEATSGQIKNQAVLSLLFKSKPGYVNEGISEMNLRDYPNQFK